MRPNLLKCKKRKVRKMHTVHLAVAIFCVHKPDTIPALHTYNATYTAMQQVSGDADVSSLKILARRYHKVVWSKSKITNHVQQSPRSNKQSPEIRTSC